MSTRLTSEAIDILKESIKKLESTKASILSGVQKLSRAAKLIGNTDIVIWCEIQFGNKEYTVPLKRYYDALVKSYKNKGEKEKKEAQEAAKAIRELGLKEDIYYNIEELGIKSDEASGGYANIGFIEERYADLVRTKSGNDGTYYKMNLNKHLNYVRKVAHNKATDLYNSLAFADSPQMCFDILKSEIDNKLLDLEPELAEKLMIAFKAVSTDNEEEWSQALTTCRRFIENLADILYPPTDKKINGRLLDKQNYINRIWAFMDSAIDSDTNRDVAKAHIDFIGSYLQKVHKQTNKGVHAKISRIEAVKTVFHTYLVIANIIEYLDVKEIDKGKLINIYSASLDEIESYLNVSRSIAKEIIKLRIEKGTFEPEELKNIKGIGPKTIARAQELFDFSS